MKSTYIFLFSCIISLNSCLAKASSIDTNLSICDKKATKETKALYQKLNHIRTKGFLFGHQDDLAYGVNWKYEANRSDVKDVVGDYPAVYGWDIAGIEKDAVNNIDGIPFDKMRQFIQDVNARGGINTISWHLDNPMTGKDAWDNSTKSISSILPKGENHQKFSIWLDKTAHFLRSLKDKNGRDIPILFRPYHELTGNWFWWGKGNCSPEDFKILWKFTFTYLQKKGVHNLIYVYNTADFNSKEAFLENYPGADYADILSFDKYQYTDPTKDNSFVEDCQKQFEILDQIAKKQHKPIAFAETGYEQIPYSKWWTETLMNAIGNYKIAYVLVWRNHGMNVHMDPPHMHYYAPYPGQVSADDFVNFYKMNSTLFEKDIK